MEKNRVDIAELTTVGFKPLVFFKDWRVATLCYTPDLYPPHIGYLERHMETDEVFVLMHGQATLLIGGNGAGVDQIETLALEPLKTFNVRQGVWHNVVVTRDAVILLVENADTGQPNSEYFTLNESQKKILLATAANYPDWRSY